MIHRPIVSQTGVFRWGAVVVVGCSLVLLAHCDSSFVPDVGEPELGSDPVEAVRLW